ncbi:MAG: ATP-binding protein [Spirochaetes bacterium]|nr:ATP-binding protein [Spirochaetota bacterium]
MKKSKTLKRHVFIILVPAAVFLCLFIWIVMRFISINTIHNEVNDEIEVQAKQASESVSKKLLTLIETIRGLAVNNLIVNGLVDVGGRVNYLPTFIESLRLPGPEDSTIVVTDYKGRQIISNKNSVVDYSKSEWLNKVLRGEEIVRVSNKKIIIAMPIRYYGSVEGLLIVSYESKDVKDILNIGSLFVKYVIYDQDKIILFSSNDGLGKIGQIYQDNEHSQWLKKQAPVADFNLTLVCAETKEIAYAQLYRMEVLWVVAVFILLLILIIGIYISTMLILHPLRDFIKYIEEIKKTQNFKLTIPKSNLKEFEFLAITFNSFISELDSAQKQLLISEKMASIGQLAAGVAHEINNPLGSISSNSRSLKKYVENMLKALELYAENIQSDQLNSQLKRLKIDFIKSDILKLIENNISLLLRMGNIVNSLKNFSRVDHKQNELSDITQGLQSAIEVSRNEWKYSADVETDFYPDLSMIHCNMSELNQVFLNIIINAAQAIQEQKEKNKLTHKGLIKVKTYEENDKEQEMVVCMISDNGPGIPNNIIDKVFDPFFTTKDVGKGSGQGLNISYDIIVNRHKGKLEVQSQVGAGTTFIIKLPKN